MTPNTDVLIPDRTYHIFNRINGEGALFKTEENYRYFLELYKRYISPIAETFCYCLMPNHFHFLIRIRSLKELKPCQGSKPLTGFGQDEVSRFLSRQFSNLFNSYAQAFNKQHGRKGSLFMRPYKRKLVTDEKYLRKLIHYIHYNPREAGLSDSMDRYRYSSYKAIIQGSSENLNTDEVIAWFGDLENFIYCHQAQPQISGLE